MTPSEGPDPLRTLRRRQQAVRLYGLILVVLSVLIATIAISFLLRSRGASEVPTELECSAYVDLWVA